MEDIDIPIYREAMDKAEQVTRRYMSNIRSIRRRVEKSFDVRIINILLNTVIEVDEINYFNIAGDVVKKLLDSQIREGDEFKHINGYTEADEALEGGFPTVVGDGLTSISKYLDVDSTCHALQTILGYSLATGYWDNEMKEAVEKGVAFLFRRDINGDGLLEQTGEEDWIIELGREGSTLYTNSMYLATLETYYRAIIDEDSKDRFIVREKLSRLIDSIERGFYLGGRYIDAISTTGAKIVRHSIDNWFIGQALTYRGSDKAISHLKNMVNTLRSKYGYTLTEASIENTWSRRNRVDNVIDPFYTSIFSYGLSINKLYDSSLKVLNTILDNIDKKIYIFKGTPSRNTRNRHLHETEVIITATLRTITSKTTSE